MLRFSMNSMRGFFPGVPSKMARVLRSVGTKKSGYLASSTKLLALLGVGDEVLGVKVAMIPSPMPQFEKEETMGDTLCGGVSHVSR
jgi:hypothetical protein